MPAVSCTMICIAGMTVPMPAAAATISASSSQAGALSHGRGEREKRDSGGRKPGRGVHRQTSAAADRAAGERRRDRDRERDRQQEQPGLAHGEAARELEVERQVQDRSEERGGEQHHRGVGAENRGDREQGQGDRPVHHATLPPYERGQSGCRDQQEAVKRGRRPREAMPGRGECVQAERAAGDEEERTRQVEAERRRRGHPSAYPESEQRCDDPEREVDREHPAPAEMLGEIAGQHQPTALATAKRVAKYPW